MTIYYYKLKNNIKNKFMYNKCVINNLNKFIKTIIEIEIDNKLYKKVIK